MDNELLGAFLLFLLGMLIYAAYHYCMKVYAYSEVHFRYSFTITVKKKEVVHENLEQ